MCFFLFRFWQMRMSLYSFQVSNKGWCSINYYCKEFFWQYKLCYFSDGTTITELCDNSKIFERCHIVFVAAIWTVINITMESISWRHNDRITFNNLYSQKEKKMPDSEKKTSKIHLSWKFATIRNIFYDVTAQKINRFSCKGILDMFIKLKEKNFKRRIALKVLSCSWQDKIWM